MVFTFSFFFFLFCGNFFIMCLKLKQELWKFCRLILSPGVLGVHIHPFQPLGKFKRKHLEHSDAAAMGHSVFLSVRTLKGLILRGFQELLSLGIRVTFIVSSWSSGFRVEARGRYRLIHGLGRVDEGSWEPEAKNLGISNVSRIPDHPPTGSQEKKQNIPLLFGPIRPFLQPWSEEQSVLRVGYCREKDKVVGNKHCVSLRYRWADVYVHTKTCT